MFRLPAVGQPQGTHSIAMHSPSGFSRPLLLGWLAASALLLTTTARAQSRDIYTNPKFREIAQQHKVLAVLPFAVTLTLRPAEVERLGPDGLADAQVREGYNVQQGLVEFLQEGKHDRNLTIDVQAADRTNELLRQHNISPEQLSQHSYAELATLLGADGLLNGTFQSSQPMSNGAAAALMVTTGLSMPTNTGRMVISLNDGPTGELLWKYDKSLSRGLGSDTRSIVLTIMRKAERQFPYAKNYKP